MTDEMYVPIVAMYTAARQGLPDRAEQLAGIAGKLASVISAFNSETAQAGDPPALTDMLLVADQIYDGIRRGVKSLNNAAIALEVTADDYVLTDEQAATEYDNWHSPLKRMDVPETPVPADNGHPEDRGFVVGAGDPRGIPRYLGPSDDDPDAPDIDKAGRDQTAQDDSEDLGLPDDPSDDY